MIRPQTLVVLSLALVSLAACGSMRESLGLGRNPPDEFAVIDRPPLSMPPDFGLRPPRPGAERLQEQDMTKRASEALFDEQGNVVPADISGISGVEKALLEQSNAHAADKNIREVIDRESSQKIVGSQHLVDDLLWWKKDPDNVPVVDADAEAERLKDAASKGEAANKGATPVIENEKSGWLGL